MIIDQHIVANIKLGQYFACILPSPDVLTLYEKIKLENESKCA
jgi:hypothetical protein